MPEKSFQNVAKTKPNKMHFSEMHMFKILLV